MHHVPEAFHSLGGSSVGETDPPLRKRLMTQRDFFKLLILSSVLSAALVLFFLRWPAPPPVQAEFKQEGTRVFDVPPSPDEEINIQIYEALSPGVVNITSTRLELNFWFDVIPRQGTGSGFFLDRQGHILTNNHVIEEAKQLEVTLADHSKFDAQVVGRDPINDIALLKIDCPPDTCLPIQLADDPILKVGQKVLAIGNPFGLERTLTTGIISSVGRSLQTRNGIIENLIQTDAAINPGNSGGPLLNRHGELIGINTAIVSRSGENVGIGFAVPVQTLTRIIPDLLEHGRVLRPWFGTRGRRLDSQLSRALQLPVEEGFLVEQVEPGSTADEAGIQGGKRRAFYGNIPILIGGDVIVELGGQPVRSAQDLIQILESKRPGDTISIAYYRGEKRIEKTVELIGPQGGRRIRL